MSRKLEELFDLPPTSEEVDQAIPSLPETRMSLAELDSTIDKIDAALPAVRDLDASDREMDDLADMAKSSYNDLMDLGMQVDSRFASEIFGVASNMLGHAITAKTAKLNKKLKMIDLQLKKARMDQDRNKDEPMDTAHGEVLNHLSRNELLEKLIGNRDQNNNKA
jgi:hypothetical protein